MTEHNVSFAEKTENFLSAHKKPLVIVLVAVVVLVAGLFVCTLISNSKKESSMADIQVIENKLDKSIYQVKAQEPEVAVEGENAETASDAAPEEKVAEKSADLISAEDAVNRLSAYSDDQGIVGVRANMLSAEINYKQNKFNEAAAAYVKAAEAQLDAYTAPVCYFNAAVCYESLETPDYEKALAYYAKAAEYKDFPKIDHAMFNVARVNETLGKAEEAKNAYEALVARESVYGKGISSEYINLAKTKLLK